MLFTLNRCGYLTHNPDHTVIDRPFGTEDYLFLYVLSPMIFVIDGEHFRAESGACMLYAPGAPQHYYAKDKFINSYIHFSCSRSAMEHYAIQPNLLFTPGSGDEIHMLLRKIFTESLQDYPHKEELLSSCIEQLLIHVERAQKSLRFIAGNLPDGNFYNVLVGIKEQMLIHSEEDWTIDRICNMSGLGKSQFYYYYRLCFSSTPKADLIHVRMANACYQLSYTNKSVREIAADVGFRNINHFHKYFRKQYGCTPDQYRKAHTGAAEKAVRAVPDYWKQT